MRNIGAHILVLVIVTSHGVRADELPSRSEIAEARRIYQDGATAYQLGNFAEAAPKFESAYRIMKAPNILFDAAQSYRRMFETDQDLGHARRAIELYKTYLREARENAANRPVAAQLVPQLEKAVEEATRRRRAEQIMAARGSEGIALAAELEAEGADREAAMALDRVISAGKSSRDVLVAALEKRGLLSAKLGNRARAVDDFKKALVLDPGFLVPEDRPSPLTADAFEEARRALPANARLAIHHVPPGSVRREGSLRIAVKVESDPLASVSALAVSFRAAGGGAYGTVKASRGQELQIPASFIAGLGGASLEYYVTALDDAENELATVGSATQPLVIAGGGAPRAQKPWFKRWWVWTVVGVVAVGAVAAGVGGYYATHPPSNPPEVPIPTGLWVGR